MSYFKQIEERIEIPAGSEVTHCGGNDFLQTLHPNTKNVSEDEKNTFLIHDNGGRPFKVIISKSTVELYAEDEKLDYCYVHSRTFFNVLRVFIGEDTNLDTSTSLRKKFRGNCILLQVRDFEYVWIGMFVMRFKFPEVITGFYSPVGNNDVPYSMASSEHWILQPCEGLYFPRTGKETFTLETSRKLYNMPSNVTKKIESEILIRRQ